MTAADKHFKALNKYLFVHLQPKITKLKDLGDNNVSLRWMGVSTCVFFEGKMEEYVRECVRCCWNKWSEMFKFRHLG